MSNNGLERLKEQLKTLAKDYSQFRELAIRTGLLQPLASFTIKDVKAIVAKLNLFDGLKNKSALAEAEQALAARLRQDFALFVSKYLSAPEGQQRQLMGQKTRVDEALAWREPKTAGLGDKPIGRLSLNINLEFFPEVIEYFSGQNVLFKGAIQPDKVGQPYLLTQLVECKAAEARKIIIRGHDRDKKAKTYELPHVVDASISAVTFSIAWYGDGEKEFPILINGLCTDDEVGKPYWKGAPEVLKAIQDETGSNFTQDDALFLDGNAHYRGGERVEAGREEARRQAPQIFAKLAKAPDGKIIQRIQVYTHSRGSAYGNGFVEELQHQIDQHAELFFNPKDVIELVFHMDPHQPEAIHVKKGVFPTYVIDHYQSLLGDIDGLTGDALALQVDTGLKATISVPFAGTYPTGEPHKLGTYGKDVKRVLDQHNDNIYNEETDKYHGIEKRFEGRITDKKLPDDK